MRVAVMHVMGVRVLVAQSLVPVGMRVGDSLQLARIVIVLMVLVVLVLMGVLYRGMGVFVLVNVSAEQQSAPCHARQRQERGRVQWLMQKDPGE